jgi:hypothetical protein
VYYWFRGEEPGERRHMIREDDDDDDDDDNSNITHKPITHNQTNNLLHDKENLVLISLLSPSKGKRF